MCWGGGEGRFLGRHCAMSKIAGDDAFWIALFSVLVSRRATRCRARKGRLFRPWIAFTAFLSVRPYKGHARAHCAKFQSADSGRGYCPTLRRSKPRMTSSAAAVCVSAICDRNRLRCSLRARSSWCVWVLYSARFNRASSVCASGHRVGRGYKWARRGDRNVEGENNARAQRSHSVLGKLRLELMFHLMLHRPLGMCRI